MVFMILVQFRFCNPSVYLMSHELGGRNGEEGWRKRKREGKREEWRRGREVGKKGVEKRGRGREE